MKPFLKFAILLATILGVSAAASAPVGGVQTFAGLLGAGEGASYDVFLRAHEPTEIYVRGDGDGDLDCALIDDRRNVIAVDDSVLDRCFLTVTPRYVGRFTIVLANAGDAATIYSGRVE